MRVGARKGGVPAAVLFFKEKEKERFDTLTEHKRKGKIGGGGLSKADTPPSE